MKRILLPLTALLLTVISYAQDPKQLVKDGIKLHDEGKYKEAISKYDEAIALDPGMYLAYYEKAFSLMSDEQYEECIKICKASLKKFPDGEENAGIYISYGTSYDMMKKPEKAIEIYEEGIKKFPRSALLHYNKAITLYNLGKAGEAEKSIEQSIINNPNHASSHQMLSVLHEKSNRMYSLLASLYFMGIEPTGKRAEGRLTITEDLMGVNVKKEEGKGLTLTISLPEDKKAPNQFQNLEILLAVGVSLGQEELFKNETKPEKMNRLVSVIISFLSDEEKKGTGLGWDFYAPFFRQLKEKDYVETYCHTIYMTAGDEANDKWMGDHRDKVEEYWKWVNNYWKK